MKQAKKKLTKLNKELTATKNNVKKLETQLKKAKAAGKPKTKAKPKAKAKAKKKAPRKKKKATARKR
jgi:hypothetical protein